MQRCTLHWNVKLYIIISAWIITLTEIHCNWDRDAFIPKYKTFLTPYHCLIFFQIHWSKKFKERGYYKEWNSCFECFCLIQLTAANVAICRKWRIRIKAGLDVKVWEFTGLITGQIYSWSEVQDWHILLMIVLLKTSLE